MKKKLKKIRADQFLAMNGLAPSRERGQSLILAGLVYTGTKRIDKPSEMIPADTELRLKGADHPYVSRGGVKVKAALDFFKISPAGKVCLDVGASTGGFTDCLLKEGAKKVYAVDVGRGQLDWSLRNDPRVVVMEKVNFRYFDPAVIGEAVDLVTVDVSFISLKKIILKVVELLGRPSLRAEAKQSSLLLLIKPQFEVGRKFVGRGGIVKDESKKKECVEEIKKFCGENGLEVTGAIPSPILGQEGNEEFLLAARRKSGSRPGDPSPAIEEVVAGSG